MLTHTCMQRTPTRHSGEHASTGARTLVCTRVHTRGTHAYSQNTHTWCAHGLTSTRAECWPDTRHAMGGGNRTVTVPLEALGQTQGQGRSAARAGGGTRAGPKVLSQRGPFWPPSARPPAHTGLLEGVSAEPSLRRDFLPCFLPSQTEPDS